MTRAFCIVALLALTFGMAPLAAQEQAPAFHATPASPAAGQPFQGTLSIFWYGTAFGVDSTPEVSGNTITVEFDDSCGFICPGERRYHDFTFAMPALAAGSYSVHVVSGNDSIGTFPLIVGGTVPPAAIPAPTLGIVSAAALALLLVFAGLRRRIV
jgi:hypothetical protein